MKRSVESESNDRHFLAECKHRGFGTNVNINFENIINDFSKVYTFPPNYTKLKSYNGVDELLGPLLIFDCLSIKKVDFLNESRFILNELIRNTT